MTTSEYYAEMLRLFRVKDERGILDLMGEHYGRLEGDLTKEQQHELGGIGRWAVRLADQEQYEAVSARVRARLEERFAREGLPRIDPDPKASPSQSQPFRWWGPPPRG